LFSKLVKQLFGPFCQVRWSLSHADKGRTGLTMPLGWYDTRQPFEQLQDMCMLLVVE